MYPLQESVTEIYNLSSHHEKARRHLLPSLPVVTALPGGVATEGHCVPTDGPGNTRQTLCADFMQGYTKDYVLVLQQDSVQLKFVALPWPPVQAACLSTSACRVCEYWRPNRICYFSYLLFIELGFVLCPRLFQHYDGEATTIFWFLADFPAYNAKGRQNELDAMCLHWWLGHCIA